MKLPNKIAVMGAGSWGTALAIAFDYAGVPVTLWAHTPALAAKLLLHRENVDYLPGARLPDSVSITEDIAEAARGAGAVFSMGPTQFARDVITRFKPHLRKGAIVVNAAKGIERTSHQTMTELAEEVLPDRFHKRLSVLSGPNFAEEVAQGLPAAAVIASRSKAAANWIQQKLSSDRLRLYTSNDPIGADIGGSMKNIFAIAAGAIDALGLGDNIRAALITRALVEIARLGKAAGAKGKTFKGLSGLGDLLLSCSSPKSRNYSVGYRLGRGESLRDILAEMVHVAEGVPTTVAATALAERHKIELPITAEVFRMLYGEKSPADCVRDLMTRELKPE
ncbi:MAG: NAD(P)-dependent glycerol-3-phosphate dehydrogenase [bacterium]|nr:NAD(P)-dependent glycerol-3-phosphate dehydrogenase [bacterium]